MIPIRVMQMEDIADVICIINETLSDPPISWRGTPLDRADVEKWLTPGPNQKRIASVAVQDGQICGVVTLGAFKTDPGYEQTKELSIYVARTQAGKGIGKALMAHCLKPREGVRRIISSIDASNAHSLRLHTRFNFAQVGFLQGIGFVNGRPRDLVLMMHTLGNG